MQVEPMLELTLHVSATQRDTWGSLERKPSAEESVHIHPCMQVMVIHNNDIIVIFSGTHIHPHFQHAWVAFLMLVVVLWKV